MKSLIIATIAALGSTMAVAEPVTYVIDGKHTFPRFSYTHLGFSLQSSRFDKTSGLVVYDAAAGSGSVEVTIDTNSVSTGSDLFNEHIRGADFLNVKDFPVATFKSTAIRFKDGAPVSIAGNLTLKGVTRPVTLEVTSFKRGEHPMMHKDAIGANASTTIRRSDFNMGKFVPAVDDELKLTISLEAQRQQ
jgi:polyisoprenoid-binding protein YceI